MTTAEKITLGVSIAGALGVGALLQAWLTHLLQRPEKKINIADKSVQIAEAMMTRMETELTHAKEALAKAEREIEELRAGNSSSAAEEGGDFPQTLALARGAALREIDKNVIVARSRIEAVQLDMQEINAYGLENWVKKTPLNDLPPATKAAVLDAIERAIELQDSELHLPDQVCRPRRAEGSEHPGV